MAQMEEGWPLGLRPLNARVGLIGNEDMSRQSVSISSWLTNSVQSSMGSSSDLDTQSTRSHFPDQGITLGTLIGISSVVELSQRSREETTEESQRDKKDCKFRTVWLFSLCSKVADSLSTKNALPCLGQFPEAENKRQPIRPARTRN